MSQIEAETKKWGNSIGVVLPKDVLENEHIKGEHEKIFMLVRKGNDTAKETFGLLKNKWKKSTQKIKDELREELYD